jgi:hypothetical protein
MQGEIIHRFFLPVAFRQMLYSQHDSLLLINWHRFLSSGTVLLRAGARTVTQQKAQYAAGPGNVNVWSLIIMVTYPAVKTAVGPGTDQSAVHTDPCQGPESCLFPALNCRRVESRSSLRKLPLLFHYECVTVVLIIEKYVIFSSRKNSGGFYEINDP